MAIFSRSKLDEMYEWIEESGRNRNCADGWYAYGYWIGSTHDRDEDASQFFGAAADSGFEDPFGMGYEDAQGDKDENS